MTRFNLLLFICACGLLGHAQGSLPATGSGQRSHDSGVLKNGVPDGEWKIYDANGQLQYLRTYSFDRWKQFQNEKSRYHPKRVSLPITKLYHENKKQAEKYFTAINSFCAEKNCAATQSGSSHYHPSFRYGLLHGAFANYFPDGRIKDSGHYTNGLPEGEWIKWTDDQQYYWVGFYKHGVKNNEWKLYATNAKLVTIVSFRSGKYLWRKDIKEGVAITEEELSGF